MKIRIKKIFIGILFLAYTMTVMLSPKLLPSVGISAFTLYLYFASIMVSGSMLLIAAAKTFNW